MSDAQLREDIRTAVGQAYGRGVAPEDIIAVLNAERERWEHHPANGGGGA